MSTLLTPSSSNSLNEFLYLNPSLSWHRSVRLGYRERDLVIQNDSHFRRNTSDENDLRYDEVSR